MTYAEWRHSVYLDAVAQVLSSVGDLSLRESSEIVYLAHEESQNRDIDLYRILGLIVAESNGNFQAVSPVGARGLMQIMPGTGEFIARKLGDAWEGHDSLFDVPRNVTYGVWYYAYLLKTFKGDEHAAIAAYNWGPEHIAGRLREGSRLPQVYPRKVYAAEKMLQEKAYEQAKSDIWRRTQEYDCLCGRHQETCKPEE